MTVDTARRCGLIADQPDTDDCDRPATVFSEMLEEIRHAIVYAPRNMQVKIGPSAIGEPCTRALIHKLCGDPEPEKDRVNLKAWVGTGIHAELERIFTAAVGQHDTDKPRYLLEKRVTVGVLGGVPFTGSVDLFDTATGFVIDWKTKTKSTLAEHRLHGPGVKYRVQAHSYGLGMSNAGYEVRHVGNIYLPRDGEFRDIIYWAEPYDPSVAHSALARAEGLLALVDTYGPDDTLALYPECDDRWCSWCARLNLPLLNPARRLSTARNA